MRKLCCTIWGLFAVIIGLNAQIDYTPQDSLIFEKYIATHNSVAGLPLEKVIVQTALYFRGTPYVASTLDKNKEERLVVNLREFDCTTFVESCLALSRTLKSNDHTFASFTKQLQNIRYRNGLIEDYTSRLHYITDWTFDNQKRGIITDFGQQLGGMLDDRKINFMSTHTDSYESLKSNTAMQKKIAAVEDNINKRGGHYIILKQNISFLKDKIKDGDIVVFATSISGLDYTHMGFAYHDNGQLTFIHASSKSAKVIVEPQSLSNYCLKSPKCLGIAVLRPNELKGK